MNQQIRENPPPGDLCKKLCNAPDVLPGNSYASQLVAGTVAGTADAEYAHCGVYETVRINDV